MQPLLPLARGETSGNLQNSLNKEITLHICVSQKHTVDYTVPFTSVPAR